MNKTHISREEVTMCVSECLSSTIWLGVILGMVIRITRSLPEFIFSILSERKETEVIREWSSLTLYSTPSTQSFCYSLYFSFFSFSMQHTFSNRKVPEDFKKFVYKCFRSYSLSIHICYDSLQPWCHTRWVRQWCFPCFPKQGYLLLWFCSAGKPENTYFFTDYNDIADDS